MDEITIINLLNKVCEKNQRLSWNLSCKYHDGAAISIMQIKFTMQLEQNRTQMITFNMESGEVLNGKYFNIERFEKGTQIVDALLDILTVEQTVS